MSTSKPSGRCGHPSTGNPTLKPARFLNVLPQPGEYDERIPTLLDSCVARVLWLPQVLLGGMCHYLQPSRPQRHEEALDGRYGDEAIAPMLEETDKAGAIAGDFQIRLFGGGNMFSCINKHKTTPVGWKNVAAARRVFRAHALSFALVATDGQLP